MPNRRFIALFAVVCAACGREAAPPAGDQNVAAAAPGMGPAWKGAVTVTKEESTTFRLTRDLPIRGWIVDLEGKPIEGVHVSVRLLRPAKHEKSVMDWIADAKKKAARWAGIASRTNTLLSIPMLYCMVAQQNVG